MNEKLRQRLSDFKRKDCLTKIRINDAIFKTVIEIGDLFECGVISIEEFVSLGKELRLNL